MGVADRVDAQLASGRPDSLFNAASESKPSRDLANAAGNEPKNSLDRTPVANLECTTGLCRRVRLGVSIYPSKTTRDFRGFRCSPVSVKNECY